MRWWVLVVLAGCYAPTAPAGAPCTEDRTCPAGLECQTVGGADVCILPGTLGPDAGMDPSDAPVDAPDDGSKDRDGDGVVNAMDLCPDVPDDQHDEDADAIGDACDPCPISNQPDDTDGDGLPDGCDALLGGADRLAMFEGFGARPDGWFIDPEWTFTEDQAQYASLMDPGSVAVALGSFSGTLIAWSQLEVENIEPNGTIGIGLGSADSAVTCGFTLVPTGVRLSLRDLNQSEELSGTLLTGPAPNTRWLVVLVREPNDRFQCIAANEMEMFSTMPVTQALLEEIAPFLAGSQAEARFEFLMLTTRM